MDGGLLRVPSTSTRQAIDDHNNPPTRVDLNLTDEHPYPPVTPPESGVFTASDQESSSSHVRALARSEADQRKFDHYRHIGWAIFGTDDTRRPTERLEIFLKISGKPSNATMYDIVCHLMNRQVGWLRFYEAYMSRDWTLASNKEYQLNRQLLFDLACQVSKSKKRQRSEGLLNGAGQRTARGQYWVDSIQTGHCPSKEELDAVAESAAEKAKQN